MKCPNSNTSPDGHGTADNQQVVDGVRESEGLCEAVPTERYFLHYNG